MDAHWPQLSVGKKINIVAPLEAEIWQFSECGMDGGIWWFEEGGEGKLYSTMKMACSKWEMEVLCCLWWETYMPFYPAHIVLFIWLQAVGPTTGPTSIPSNLTFTLFCIFYLKILTDSSCGRQREVLHISVSLLTIPNHAMSPRGRLLWSFGCKLSDPPSAQLRYRPI